MHGLTPYRTLTPPALPSPTWWRQLLCRVGLHAWACVEHAPLGGLSPCMYARCLACGRPAVVGARESLRGGR